MAEKRNMGGKRKYFEHMGQEMGENSLIKIEVKESSLWKVRQTDIYPQFMKNESKGGNIINYLGKGFEEGDSINYFDLQEETSL